MLDKRLNFTQIEKNLISEWEISKIFKFKRLKKRPYTIIMPPPNITGSLHMGHALTFTLQDILIRFNKKLGMNVLWQPGTDHAGIATEIIVEKQTVNELNKTKKDLGREVFLKKIWDWKEKSGNTIIEQLKKLGTSVDWSISRFTLDEECSEAVKNAFIQLFNDGLIYQDKRLVNWDPKLETAVSDLEVNQKEVNGYLWYIKYKIVDSEKNIIVATTRPETMFGDVAVAIHPKNKSLKHLIGKEVLIPLMEKKIPIIADTYADPLKGSGVVKITPAHDFNDFIVGKNHKLDFINILDTKAKLNTNTPKQFVGLDRYEARKEILKRLDQTNQLHKVENNKMFLPVGDRSGTVLEPYLTEQWYLDSKKLCQNVMKSIKKNEIKFFPNSWMNTFKHWIKNIEPWCISRQIWWGHRIPVWHTDGKEKIAAKSLVEAEAFRKKNNIKSKIIHQENDVLDTWFSSALWPFSTLGWPKNNNILKNHYPSDVLVTGFDIIFFWVARMIMMGLYFKKSIPFKNIYIHPLVRDEKGEKMSKSKGNVIDPLQLIELYGADSLRFTLAYLSTQGRDIKLSNKLVENSRNFMTKIWNVARFSQFNNFKKEKKFNIDSVELTLNLWMIKKLQETKLKVIKHLKDYKFNLLINDLYQLVWSDFCDIYIEFCKVYIRDKKKSKEISNSFSLVFEIILNLLNPIIPFITEKISKELNYSNESIFKKDINYQYLDSFIVDEKKIEGFEKLVLLIKAIRAEFHGKILKNTTLHVISKKKNSWVEEYKLIINSILNIKDIVYSNKIDGVKIIVVSNCKFGIISNETKSDDLRKKINFYKNEIKFFEKKLSNKKFLEKAPQKIINENKDKLSKAKENLELLK